jgi:SAM-dependent methyltransferase
MSEIMWPDNTFDFICATQVFEHVADQELAYREIYRVMKPGGVFLNIFPRDGVRSRFTQHSLWRRLQYRGPTSALAGARRKPGTFSDRPGRGGQLCSQRGVNYLSGRQGRAARPHLRRVDTEDAFPAIWDDRDTRGAAHVSSVLR